MPYGLDLFKFDQQVTTSKLQAISKQFDAVQTGEAHVVMFMHKMDDSKMVREVLNDRRYIQPCNFCWIKPNHSVVGPVKAYTPAFEVGTVGFYPDRNQVPWNVSEDPIERKNYIVCPSLKSLAKNSDGNDINVTQKPPEIAEWLVSNHCSPGSTLLIIGPGAGGEVIGACRSGVNVVGVEVDEAMYNGLNFHLNAIVSAQKNTMLKEAKARAKAQKGVIAASGESLADWNPEVAGLPPCPACGDAVDNSVDEQYRCADCTHTPKYHPTCIKPFVRNEKTIYLCENCEITELATQPEL